MVYLWGTYVPNYEEKTVFQYRILHQLNTCFKDLDWQKTAYVHTGTYRMNNLIYRSKTEEQIRKI